MIREIWSEHIGKIAIGCAVLAASIYIAMILITLAHLQTVAGQVPFDMRPTGYSYEDADALLNALGEDGRAYYLRYQISLDTLYPALLAMTLVATIGWLGAHFTNRIILRVGVAVSVGAALFDYGENLGIVLMLLNWPNISDRLVNLVSAASVSKAVLTTLAVTLVLILGLVRARYAARAVRS